MTRLLLVGLAAAGLATAGYAQTPIPGGAAQPAPTGTVTGSATTQTNPTGTTGTVTGTGTTAVPGVGGATTTTTGTGMIQVPNQFTMPGTTVQQGVYGQPYTTTYPYGVNPYQQQGVMTTGYNGTPYGGVVQTGGYAQGPGGAVYGAPVAGVLASGSGCSGCSAPVYQQPVSYASYDNGCCGKKKRGLFRR